MKISLKLCLSCLAFVLFGVAIAMFALSFANYQGVISGNSQIATGFELAFNQSKFIEDGKGLGTLFAFIFVVIGLLASCYAVLVSLKKGKKKSKGNGNAKLLCALCSFVICGVIPAILLFLTLKTACLEASASVAGRVLAETKLGVGAILAAIFSLVGACSLSLAELK